ncbi:hypothetical protein A2U01_0113230, partial [Trifolium medium]|nr:hypothetical protein [Trifolium medium]
RLAALGMQPRAQPLPAEAVWPLVPARCALWCAASRRVLFTG